MPIVPAPKLERLAFYEEHVTPWTANAAAIGLTPALMTAFTPKVTAARAAYTAQQAAKAAAKAATEAFDNAMRTLHDSGGGGAELIRVIKNYAESKSDPNVYVLAQIPAPTPPTAAPPPGTPEKLTVGLLQTGAVVLKWKCQNPAGVGGTVYEVMRQNAGSPNFVYVGSSGTREFLDDTITGSPVIYRITAVRSTVRGEPAEFTVKFGEAGGGNFTVLSVTPTSSSGNSSSLAA